MRMFRYKRSIPVDYDTQGYICFLLRRFHKLEKAEQKRLRELCRKAAGMYGTGVLEYLTTDADADYICARHHLSPSTLERMVKKVYVAVADVI